MFRLPDYWPKTYLMVGCAAFLISVVLMPLAIYGLRRLGVMDGLDENKIHTKATPRGGGIVIFIAFAVAVLLPGYRSDEMNGIMVGAFICLLVGAADDYFGGIGLPPIHGPTRVRGFSVACCSMPGSSPVP
jgi:UDP-N-acetylmuramyl pentapeptide phosphotransferase/UDP-N-acetylglucosamine-1-phosphate transferase